MKNYVRKSEREKNHSCNSIFEQVETGNIKIRGREIPCIKVTIPTSV